jgi:hypothetical protein
MKTYKAHCIENGELFAAVFNTAETDELAIIKKGDYIASGWGGDCYKIDPVEFDSTAWNADLSREENMRIYESRRKQAGTHN